MPSDTPARIFVSYSSVNRGDAERLVDEIRKSAPGAFEVLVDRAGDLRASDIPSGEYWLPHLATRLHGAHAVLALVSKPYLNSDMCWFEGSTALAMGKLIPIKIDSALPDGEITEPFRNVNIPTLDVGALFEVNNGRMGEGSSQAVDSFRALLDNLKVVSTRRRPFQQWEEAESYRVGETALALTRAYRWPLPRKHLTFSRGKLGQRQRFRFLAAVGDFSNCAGPTPWDVARRRALKGLHQAPADTTVRAAVLLGLIGELLPGELSPGDRRSAGKANSNPEPWRWLGDLALPFDREISRFAYARAGDIPNDVRETFQLMPQRPSGRVGAGLTGAGVGLAIGTGVGIAIATALGSGSTPAPPQPKSTAEPQSMRSAKPQAARPAEAPATTARPVPGATTPPSMVSDPISQPAAAPSQTLFSVGGRGLEATVKLKMDGLSAFRWQEVYAAAIAVNVESLCSPLRRAQAGENGDPLNIIAQAETFRWPSVEQIQAHRAGPRACPATPAVIVTDL